MFIRRVAITTKGVILTRKGKGDRVRMPIGGMEEGGGGGGLLWPTKNVIKYKRKGGISCKVIINVGACDGELPPQTFGNTRISHIPFTVRSSTLTLGKGCSIPGRSSILISHWHRFSLCQKSGYRSSIHPFSPPLIKRTRVFPF